MTTFTAIHESKVALPITSATPREITRALRTIHDLRRTAAESSNPAYREWAARSIRSWRRLVREYRHTD